LFVNGKKAEIAANQLLKYMTKVQLPSQQKSWDKYGIDTYNYNQYRSSAVVPAPHVLVNRSGIAKLKRDFPDSTFTLFREAPYQGNMDSIPAMTRIQNLRYFPNDLNICNTVSDFQKFWIPKKGVTITLTEENISYYRRIITTHEGHSLKENKDGTFMIDGKKTNKYTFAMNYYWMMGDNRYNSTDARMWGFVPEDHIVGKASMVWFSSGPSGVRWDRLFTGIK
jgi:signal peptidase I